jgi:hypothetical protein
VNIAKNEPKCSKSVPKHLKIEHFGLKGMKLQKRVGFGGGFQGMRQLSQPRRLERIQGKKVTDLERFGLRLVNGFDILVPLFD